MTKSRGKKKMPNEPAGLDEIIKILTPSKTAIAMIWMEKPSVIEIFARHKISRKKFIPLFAKKVIQYFIDVLNGVKEVGNCPVMNKFIDYMSDKEISVKEIFLICMAFRRSMFDHLIANGQLLTQDTTILEHLSEVFDQNLSGVLDYFARQDISRETQTQHDHDEIDHTRRVQTILDLQDHMIVTIKSGKVFLANKAFLHAFGVSDITAFETLFPNTLDFIKSIDHDEKISATDDNCLLLTTVSESVSQKATLHLFNRALQRSQPYNAKVSRMPGDDKESFVITLGEFSECDEKISELSRYVYRDTLTNLFNRKKFDESLETLIGQYHNSDVTLSMVIIDLSDLNNINHMHGRERGDEIIIKLAHSIDQAFGPLGIFSRTESDRFGLLLKSYPLEKGIETAKRIHTLINDLRSELRIAPICNIAVVHCHKGDTHQSMLARADRLINDILQDGGNKIKDDQTLIDEENDKRRMEKDFLKSCIELKAADKTLDVTNYYQEVPIQSRSTVVDIKKGGVTFSMRKIALNALHKGTSVYISAPEATQDIKAHVASIDHDRFTITVDRFWFVKSSPLDRKSLHVKVDGDLYCFVKMDDTQIKGVLESLSTDTAMVRLPHIHGITMDSDILLDTTLRWEGHEEHIELHGKTTKIMEDTESFRVVIRLEKSSLIDEVVTPYVAHRQLEIIKVLQRSVF